jgi:putative ABC transport system permease protein
MNRVKLYWTYATRSLRRGGQRTLLAIFCIAVGVMAIVSLELVGNMVNTALTGNVRAAMPLCTRRSCPSLPT